MSIVGKDEAQQAAADRQMTLFARKVLEDMQWQSPKNIDYYSYYYYGFLYILYLNSFARKVLEDMPWLSPKNIAWALNALTGRPGYDLLFESAAARLCEVPSDDPQWSIQSAALISNALSHGSDGIFFSILFILCFLLIDVPVCSTHANTRARTHTHTHALTNTR